MFPRISTGILVVVVVFSTLASSAYGNSDSCSPDQAAQGTCTRKEDPSKPARRFAIGDVVMANMGRGRWKLGKILHQNYREESWEPGQVAPYVIELEAGGSVFAPVDNDNVVKRASPEEAKRVREADALEKRLRPVSERYKAAQLEAARSIAAVTSVGDGAELEAILRYHAESCHVHPRLYARGGQMDWANQPDKFRRFLGAVCLDLPRSGPQVVVAESEKFSRLRNLDSLGVLMHDAAGLTAWKSQGGDVKYSLRANPSSGALQPLEIFVFGAFEENELTGASEAVLDASGRVTAFSIPPAHYHYNPYWHSLEKIAPLPIDRWNTLLAQLPAGAFLVALTSIVWRNAWKYGDPGFRCVGLVRGACVCVRVIIILYT